MISKYARVRDRSVPDTASFWMLKRIDGALTGNKFSVGNVLVVKPEKPSDAFYLCWFENRIEGRNDLIKVVWLEEKHGWYYEGTEDSIFMSSIITKTKLNEYKDEQNNSYWLLRDGELANVALELQTHAADYEIIIEQPTSPHPLPTRLKRERDEPGSLPKRAIQAFPISTCVLEFTQDQIEHLSEGKPFVEWMINENLLASPSSCTGCHYNTLHLEDSSHFAGDHCCWRCTHCYNRFSVRHESFFEFGTATAKEWDVNLKSVYKQWHRVRELMSKDIRSCPVQFSASLDIANYEVDEAYIEHIWVDADQPYLNQLVLGIKHRETGRLFVRRVRDRKAATLCPIIMKNIPQHDRVILHTDEFSSYKKLSDHYFHYTCNHSKADYAHTDELPAKLGSGELEVTINHLESDWGELKSMVLHHMNKESVRLDLAIDELMFRKSRRKLFDLFRIAKSSSHTSQSTKKFRHATDDPSLDII